MRIPILALLLLAACSGSGPDENDDRGLARVEITLDYPLNAIPPRDTARVSLRGFGPDGTEKPTGPVVWASENPTVATVDLSGLVTARANGTTRITGTAGNRAANLSITVSGTLHDGPVVDSESWTAGDAPHVVAAVIVVGAPEGVVLTVGPGVSVYFKPDTRLDLGEGGPARLIANGVSGGITFRGFREGRGYWTGITFRGAGLSELSGVTLRDCGRATPLTGCLSLLDPPGAPSAPAIRLQNVIIEQAVGVGLAMEGRARFESGSTALTVRSVTGHVATVPAPTVAAFPTGGGFTDNQAPEIRVLNGVVDQSGAWPDLGLTWRLMGPVLVEGSAPVLTIPPGSRFLAASGAGFIVGKSAPGGLLLGATAGAPVTMEPASDDPWVGLQFHPHALSSAVRQATLRRCGAFANSGFGNGCVFFIGDFAGLAPAPVFEHVTIDEAEAVGIVAVGGGRFGAGSADLAIRGTNGVPFEMEPDALPTIPTGDFTGNQEDVVRLYGYEVTFSQTWRDIGLAYVVPQGLSLEHPANPVLTLEAGVTLRFGNATMLRVGVLGPGGLRVLGTAAEPVVFSGYHPTPHPGFWLRVELGPLTDPGLTLQHLVVDYAGADDGQVAAGVHFLADLGPALTNSLVRRSGGCGVRRGGGGAWVTDFTTPALGNQFQNNAGAAQCGP